jgi:hypothetical protein
MQKYDRKIQTTKNESKVRNVRADSLKHNYGYAPKDSYDRDDDYVSYENYAEDNDYDLAEGYDEDNDYDAEYDSVGAFESSDVEYDYEGSDSEYDYEDEESLEYRKQLEEEIAQRREKRRLLQHRRYIRRCNALLVCETVVFVVLLTAYIILTAKG